MDDVERRHAMDWVVQQETVQGWRLVSRTEHGAVFERGDKPNHVLHLLLTVFTCGLWAVIWLLLAISSKTVRKQMWVDEEGVVQQTEPRVV